MNGNGNSDASGGLPALKRFGSLHLFYAVAVFAAALALFDAQGTLVALTVLSFWVFDTWCNLTPASTRFAKTIFQPPSCLLAVVAGFCLVGLLMPALQTVHSGRRRPPCANNVRQLIIALHNYHDAYGHLPPAYVADENGNPMHSWRILVLPFFDDSGLYEKYDFDEPWDGPNNRKLVDQLDANSPYFCPHQPNLGHVQRTSW